MMMFSLNKNEVVEFKPLQYMILKSIAYNLQKFKKEFGNKVVLAIDSRQSWRKEIFPYYKYSRKVNRAASTIPWDQVYLHVNQLVEDFKTRFPYIVVEINKAEGDDIIGTLVPHVASTYIMENILILSGDKDFRQLHTEHHIKQYSPVLKCFLSKPPSTEDFIKEHIIKGDRVDDVPNILSSDDVFIDATLRQKKITSGRLEKYMSLLPEQYEKHVERNYYRNKVMIDLRCVPNAIKQQIVAEFDQQISKPKTNDVFNYLFESGQSQLVDIAGTF